MSTSNRTINAGQVGQSLTDNGVSRYGPLRCTWTYDNGSGEVEVNSSIYTVSFYADPSTGKYSSTLTRNGGFYEADSGSYRCTTSSIYYNFSLSNITVLTVLPAAPIISSITGGGDFQQPAGSIINLSSTLSQGSLPINYQWSFLSFNAVSGQVPTNIPGATSSFYIISNIQSINNGTYTCTATNSVGSGSLSTSLGVSQPPVINNTISSQTVLPSTLVQFVCNAFGTQPITYQWYFNGSKINSATNSSYVINSCVYSQAGTYYCIATNTAGSTQSNTANLAMFKTQSNCIVDAKTINSGEGYYAFPPFVITGGQGKGATLSITGDKQYIRRIRIPSGINRCYTSTPTLTLTGGGNSGCQIVPITSPIVSDYYIQQLQIPSAIAQKVVATPVTVTINGNGTGAKASANLSLPPSGRSIVGIKPWSQINSATFDGGNNRFTYNACPFFVSYKNINLACDATVTSSDGNGSGLEVSVSFSDITGQFLANQNQFMVATFDNSLNFDNLSYIYNTIFNPIVTVTNPGSGYTSAPKIKLSNFRDAYSNTPVNPIYKGWYVPDNIIKGLVNINYPGWRSLLVLSSPTAFTVVNKYRLMINNRIDTWNVTHTPEMANFLTSGTLPLSNDAIVFDNKLIIDSINVTSQGSGYGNTTTCTVTCGDGSTSTSLAVMGTRTNVVLDAIGIITQGNGFTSTPTVTVSGPGGSTYNLPVDMSCSALGQLTLTDNNQNFPLPPKLDIIGGGYNAKGASAVAILSNSVPTGQSSLLAIWLTNALTNVYFSNSAAGSTAVNGITKSLSNSLIFLTQSFINQNFKVVIDPPSSGGTQATAVINAAACAFIAYNGQVHLQIGGPYGSPIQITNYGSGYTSTPNVSIRLSTSTVGNDSVWYDTKGRSYGPTTGIGNFSEVVFATAQAIVYHPISQIAITDNGAGYSDIPIVNLYGQKYLDVGSYYTDASHIVIGSTGYASNFTPTVTNPGTGYSTNTSSTFTNRTFVEGIEIVGNNQFTSVPTVTSSDGNGTFAATINTGDDLGISLTIANGGSGYTVYRDLFTQLANRTANIQITPDPRDTLAQGASAIPVITGSISKLFSNWPASPFPWLPDVEYTNGSGFTLSWGRQYGSNMCGMGNYFEITNAPGDTTGSGLQIGLIVKTAAELGITYNGQPLSVNNMAVSTTNSWKAGWSAPDAVRMIYDPNCAPMGAGIWGTGLSGGVVDEGGNQSKIITKKWCDVNCPFLVGFTITNPGSGYTQPPIITFHSGAYYRPQDHGNPTVTEKPYSYPISWKSLGTAEVSLSCAITGPITGFSGVNKGGNYLHPPTVSVNSLSTPPNVNPGPVPLQASLGSGAVITASTLGIQANTIKNIYVLSQGTGWSGPAPTLTITGPEGSSATATPIMGASFMEVAMTSCGLYKTAPKVVITDPAGPGAGAQAIATMVESASKPGYLTVSRVIFSSYGDAYANPVVTFVRNPSDTVFTGQVDASASAKMIYDSNWPSIASAVPLDGYGSGAVIALKTSTELCISGTTGPVSGVVQIPKTVTGILKDAFRNLEQITTVVFQSPSKCTVIGDPVFGSCTGLESVYIPPSMEFIDTQAFLNCSSLKNVVIEGNTGPHIVGDAFEGCSPDLSVYVPSTFTSFAPGQQPPTTVVVTPEVEQSKPQVLSITGRAGAKSILSNYYLNGIQITTDGAGNIYGSVPDGRQLCCLNTNSGNVTVITPPMYPYIVDLVYARNVHSMQGLFIVSRQQIDETTIRSTIYFHQLVDSVTMAEEPIAIATTTDVVLGAITVDIFGNVYVVNKDSIYKPILQVSSVFVLKAVTTGELAILDGFSLPTEEFPDAPSAVTCDKNGVVYTAYTHSGVVVWYPPNNNGGDPLPTVYATGLSSPNSLAFDNFGNLYVGNDSNTDFAGVSVVVNTLDIDSTEPIGSTGPNGISGNVRVVTTFINGFFVVPGTMLHDPLTDSLVFSDGYNFCSLSIKDHTTAPPSLVDALTTHDYEQIQQIINTVPGENFILSTADIISINSTLGANAQVALPNNPVTYVSPNADGSVTVSQSGPNSKVVIATSFPPNQSTTLTLGFDVLTVTYNPNGTDVPTLTISGSGVFNTIIATPGDTFHTISGTKVTIYSIGLTVFDGVYGDVFVPGIGGVPPPVCKPKKQGIDYSLFLSSQLSNADVQTYKQAGAVDMSEWIRRKRTLHSTKFGTC